MYPLLLFGLPFARFYPQALHFINGLNLPILVGGIELLQDQCCENYFSAPVIDPVICRAS
jgi:hypothetical protein